LDKENEDSLAFAVRLLESELHDEAVKILSDFVKQNPDSLEGYYNLGLALAASGKREEAIKAYDEALAIDNRIFEVWFNKATVLYDIADFKAAKDCYEQAIDLRPDDAEAWNNLGNAFSRLGDGKQAIEAYTRAVLLDAEYAEAFYNKANAHFIEEEYERAVAYAELAIELNPQLIGRVKQWIQVARDNLDMKQRHEERLKKKEAQDSSQSE
jgi:tetratricopeptide (TPR) repeat protein